MSIVTAAMQSPRQDDLLDYCILAKEGRPRRAPLDIDAVFQFLVTPLSLDASYNSGSGPCTVLFHRETGKYLLCNQITNAGTLAARVHTRLVLGKGAAALRNQPCPIFCPACHTLVENQDCLARHLLANTYLSCQRSNFCRAMQSTTRRLTQAVSSTQDYQLKLQALHDLNNYTAPITPDVWIQEAGDFAHWVNFHLQTHEHLHQCPLCSWTFTDQSYMVQHLSRQSVQGRGRLGDPLYCLRPEPPPVRTQYLVKLTDAYISKLLPGDEAHPYHIWFARLLSWANMVRGALLCHYAKSMSLHRYLKQAANQVPIDLLHAVAEVLGTQLASLWPRACRGLLELATAPVGTACAAAKQTTILKSAQELTGATYREELSCTTPRDA
jgi:hypothetical protein